MLSKKTKRNIGVASFILGLSVTMGAGLYGASEYSNAVQAKVSQEVIRFHVRANSDSEDDQRLKVLVKDMVLQEFADGLNAAETIEDTREFLLANADEIESYAGEVIKSQGYSYPVTAGMASEYFPTRQYGDVRLPAGQYEAMRIDIGSATGQNWWCVMFPPLCFVDVSVKEIPEKDRQILQTVLDEDGYELITGEENEIKLKFKVVELWQELKGTVEAYASKDAPRF